MAEPMTAGRFGSGRACGLASWPNMNPEMPMIEIVPAAEWSTWIDETGGRILDIREPFEWEQGTLPGATLMSMGELPGRLEELSLEQALLVVCRSGGRSHQVAMYLTMNGYARVANMAGGMKALGLQD